MKVYMYETDHCRPGPIRPSFRQFSYNQTSVITTEKNDITTEKTHSKTLLKISDDNLLPRSYGEFLNEASLRNEFSKHRLSIGFECDHVLKNFQKGWGCQ